MKGTDHKEPMEREDLLEELFSHAKLRERPPADTERAIRESLQRQWEGLAAHRRRRKLGFSFAAAAALMMAVLISGYLARGPAAPVAGLHAAAVEQVRGRAFLHAESDGAATGLEPGASLVTAQAVSTAHGAGLALRWRNGIVLRLDQNSRVIITSQQSLELTAGRIYIDTAGAGGRAVLELATPAGIVRHLGTRYMVAVNLGATSVAVREGRVSFGADDTIALAGEKLLVDASGEQRRERIEIYGADWQWTESLAEPMPPDGRSVAELLDWIGHETGRSVSYANAQAERLAAETRLHGDVGLEPGQALELITRSTDLAADQQEGTIVVDLAPLR